MDRALDPTQCKGWVHDPQGWRGRQCTRKPSDGAFCKTHSPATIEAKSAAKAAQYEAQYLAQRKALDARAEQARRAACHDDLLAALGAAQEALSCWEERAKEAGEWEPLDGQESAVMRQAKQAIAKAEGA